MRQLITSAADVSGCSSVEEALKLSDLNWQPLKEATQFADGTPTGGFALRRSDTKACISGHKSVSEDYTPLPNLNKMEVFQRYVDSGKVKFDGAGSFAGGRVIFLIGKIVNEEADVTVGDSIHQYIMLSDSFDGSRSVRFGFPAFRMHCFNALPRLNKHVNSRFIRLRHSKDVITNFMNVADVLDAVHADFAGTIEQFKLLANRNINQKDLTKFFRTIIEVETDIEKELPTRTQNTIDSLIEKYYGELGTSRKIQLELMQKAFDDPKEGNNVQIARGTWFNALMASSQYFSHDAGRGLDTRMQSLFWGKNGERNEKSLEIALSMSA